MQVPWLASLPVLTWLGWPAATAWGWKVNTSLGYVGQVTPASGCMSGCGSMASAQSVRSAHAC